MFDRNYRTLPMSFSFLTLPEPTPGYNHSADVTYTPELVDKLICQPSVITDLNRADMRFGKSDEKVSWANVDCTNPDAYYAAVLANAHANDVLLSLDQVKVLVGYLHSARGKWVQLGITSLPFGTLKLLLMSNLIGPEGRDDVYHRIAIKNNQIHISHVFYTSQLYLFMKDIHIDLGRPLIKKIHNYVVVENNGVYKIENIPSKHSVRVDKEFYKKYLLPVVTETFVAKTDLSEPVAGGVSMDIFAPVPFLSDNHLAKIFFEKIVEPVDVTSGTPPIGSYKSLMAPEKIQHADDYLSLCYDDYPEKKNKLRKQLYTADLKSIVQDEQFELSQRQQARKILRQINLLPRLTQKKYMHVITDVLEYTSKSIREPRNYKHVMQLESAAQFLVRKHWAKKLASALAVFIGITILTVSVMAAVASFGGTSVLSVAGISVGTNLVIQSLALSSSVLGGFIAACGVAYARYSPLKNFYQSTLPFWSGKKPVASTDSLEPPRHAARDQQNTPGYSETPGEHESPGEYPISTSTGYSMTTQRKYPIVHADSVEDKPRPPGGCLILNADVAVDRFNIQCAESSVRTHRIS